jgi:hypothetical protein
VYVPGMRAEVKMAFNDFYRKAIKRNLYEVAHALMEVKILNAMGEYNEKEGIYGENFFSISYRAAFNDMIAHTIKVLEDSRDSSTFWSIFQNDQKKIMDLSSCSGESIDLLRTLATKVKLVRDKSHFHIDRKGVMDPEKIWHMADIKGVELEKGLKILFNILNELYEGVHGKGFLFQPEDYSGEDVIKILKFAKSENLI